VDPKVESCTTLRLPFTGRFRCLPTRLYAVRRVAEWMTLAQHLLADFSDVPSNSIIDELAQAKGAIEFFQLDHPDALDCAEMIVRHRVLNATSGTPSSSTRTPALTAIAHVA